MAPITGTSHSILLPWTQAGATYLAKIPPRKERLGTLFSETASTNNLRLVTTETEGKKKERSFPLCGQRCYVHQDKQ